MPRPPSIIAFERLYLASLAVYLVSGFLSWTTARETALSATGARGNTEAMQAAIGPVMLVTLAVTVLVSVLLWYLVARRRSIVGKWLVVVSEAIGAVLAVLAIVQLVASGAPNAAGIALGAISTALAVVAAVMLFRPDTKPWFGESSMLDGRA